MQLWRHAPGDSCPQSRPESSRSAFREGRGQSRLYTALANHGGFEQISFCTAEQPPLSSLQRQFGVTPGAALLSISPLNQTNAAAQAGTLAPWSALSFRSGMGAGPLSWASGLQPGRDDPYPGSSQGARADRRGVGIACAALGCPDLHLPGCASVPGGLVGSLAGAPQPAFWWNSRAAAQLPLLPLGVDQAALLEQRADQSSRNFLRRHLRLAEKDVLVLWLGRLSFFEKAYPQGMFIALQKAAQRCGRRLHFVMAGWFPGGESDHSRYQEVARFHAPDVPVHFLDGKNPEVVRCCWAAADLFLSLVDNPQETFGLAPVEAMAAGLPVVVSDWDGYRYTVSDGVEGFFSADFGSCSCTPRRGAGPAT